MDGVLVLDVGHVLGQTVHFSGHPVLERALARLGRGHRRTSDFRTAIHELARDGQLGEALVTSSRQGARLCNGAGTRITGGMKRDDARLAIPAHGLALHQGADIRLLVDLLSNWADVELFENPAECCDRCHGFFLPLLVVYHSAVFSEARIAA